MVRVKKLIVVCALIAICCLMGCGRRLEMVEVHGTVTYANKPVPKGIVSFFPIDGNGRSAAGIVADGKYSAKAPPGQKQVQIQAVRIVGRKRAEPTNPNSPIVDIEEQILPDCYHAKSTLTCEIKAGGGEQNFLLKYE